MSTSQVPFIGTALPGPKARAMLDREFGIEPARATALLAEKIGREREVTDLAGRSGRRGSRHLRGRPRLDR